jgi:hypothetical protein
MICTELGKLDIPPPYSDAEPVEGGGGSQLERVGHPLPTSPLKGEEL